ncbi:DUF5412 family protein [Motilimonas eburnea]|uniref:DUF5412 family protein n=1 Tax=Motilimonas eburnea TaxID=1737488 RepID=UPI001E51ECCA|nr:hypothetical protein [Motilimonas eburnea]MCE2570046.1 hypothetical protein [Motilimonas eburnea]
MGLKTWQKVAMTLAFMAVGIPAILAIMFIVITSDLCGNEKYAEVLSPNKEYKAVIFQRDCGATTGFSTHISLLDVNKELGNEAGNIFVIEGLANQVAPNIRWISDFQLNIHRSLIGTERLAQTSWGVSSQIKVVYSPDGH